MQRVNCPALPHPQISTSGVKTTVLDWWFRCQSNFCLKVGGCWQLRTVLEFKSFSLHVEPDGENGGLSFEI